MIKKDSHYRSFGRPYGWFQGAGHGAEVRYVFGMSVQESEVGLSLNMMDGWTNFAKYG